MPLVRDARVPPPSDDDEFEELVVEALRARHGNPHLVRYGRSGQTQHGIDGWDSVNPKGLVWQATVQKRDLLTKLRSDLDLFDNSGIADRSVFIFAMGVPRDATLQREVMTLCDARQREDLCAVEPLFWEDLRQHFDRRVLERFYPEYAPEAPPSIATGLLCIGWGLIMEATLLEQRGNQWTFDVDGHFLRGARTDISGYIEGYDSVRDTGWVCSEAVGVGRVLSGAPTLQGRRLSLHLLERAQRTSAYDAGKGFELGEDGDIYPDLRMVAGFPFALQRMRIALSTPVGDLVRDSRFGSRCREFFTQGFPPETLGRLFAVELARMAFIPFTEERVALPFVDRVVSIEVPVPTPDNSGELLVQAHLILAGHGEWQGPLRVVVDERSRVRGRC